MVKEQNSWSEFIAVNKVGLSPFSGPVVGSTAKFNGGRTLLSQATEQLQLELKVHIQRTRLNRQAAIKEILIRCYN